MSIDMSVSSSQEQATSVNTMCQKQIQGYQQLQQAINQFVMSSAELQGKTYDSAKQYFSAVLLPLAKGGMLLSEAVSKACQKFPDDYQSQVDSADLKSSELEEQIKQYQQGIDMANAILQTVSSSPLPDPTKKTVLDSVNNVKDGQEKAKKKLEEKLEKLKAFDASSPSIFSEIVALESAINRGAAQAATCWNGATGMFTIPKNMSWVDEIKSYEDKKRNAKKEEEKQKKAAIKELNDLIKKNPIAALDKVRNNDKLFGYVIAALDKFPDSFQDMVLEIFIMHENWSLLPKKAVTSLLNSPKFAFYMNKLSTNQQALIYRNLVKLSDKGWDVFAPMSYAVGILSKTSKGAKIIEGTKVGLTAFKKLKRVADFIKAHPAVREGLSYGGDLATVTAYAYEEYCNPESPAYGDLSKAFYGGINLFMLNAGVLEGLDYGGPVGALAGFANSVVQGKITVWPDKILGFDLPGKEIKTPGLGSEKAKREWIEKQYKQYGKHNSSPTDKNYRTGVQPESGSPSFNPSTNYTPK